VPQLGNVVIEEHVEIGSGATIDRATMGSTVIRQGAKIDNLVMIAHNVQIGAHTAVAAQTGIAGSTVLGAHCMLGGQTGIAGHLNIADGTRIQAQSGVNRNIKEPGSTLYGSPALPYHDFLRAYAVFRKLPDLQKRLDELERSKNS
jgi:UDP-3-O-[3-hydroxymyristoyl] glucosamine N-acyltransferase